MGKRPVKVLPRELREKLTAMVIYSDKSDEKNDAPRKPASYLWCLWDKNNPDYQLQTVNPIKHVRRARSTTFDANEFSRWQSNITDNDIQFYARQADYQDKSTRRKNPGLEPPKETSTT